MILLLNYLSRFFEDSRRCYQVTYIIKNSIWHSAICIICNFSSLYYGKIFTRGPKIAHCDALNNISYHKTYESFTCTLCVPFVKYLCINFKVSKVKPCVFSFAIRIPWLRQLNILERLVSRAPKTCNSILLLFR